MTHETRNTKPKANKIIYPTKNLTKSNIYYIVHKSFVSDTTFVVFIVFVYTTNTFRESTYRSLLEDSVLKIYTFVGFWDRIPWWANRPGSTEPHQKTYLLCFFLLQIGDFTQLFSFSENHVDRTLPLSEILLFLHLKPMPQLMPFSQISLFPQCLLVSLFLNILINLLLKNSNCSCLHEGRGDHKEPRKGHKKVKIRLKDAEKTRGRHQTEEGSWRPWREFEEAETEIIRARRSRERLLRSRGETWLAMEVPSSSDWSRRKIWLFLEIPSSSEWSRGELDGAETDRSETDWRGPNQAEVDQTETEQIPLKRWRGRGDLWPPNGRAEHAGRTELWSDNMCASMFPFLFSVLSMPKWAETSSVALGWISVINSLHPELLLMNWDITVPKLWSAVPTDGANYGGDFFG